MTAADASPPPTPPGPDQWSSPLGFVLATVGAAVGLGNLWRFAYVAGENGGGTFLLVYLSCIVLIGAPIVVAELAVGRHGRGEPVAAVRAVAPGSIWQLAGWLGVAGAFGIMAFYLVVAGWALKYFAGALTGGLWGLAGDHYGGYFEDFIASPVEPVFWQAAMAAAAVAVVAGGVRGGIERTTRVLMPLLALIVVALAAWGVSHAGAAEGLAFLFAPDWAALARPEIYLAALGQAFFSLSVGMALFLTYGSYLARDHRIPSSAAAVIAGDTLIAVLAGVAIFPAVFALGVDPAAGPRLAFITLPQVFLAMPAGQVVGTVFFFLLAAAALSASISGVEVVTSFVARRFGLRRRRAVLAVGAALFAAGVPASLGYGLWSGVVWRGRGILESMDFAISNGVLPLGGLLLALAVGWRWEARTAMREADLGDGLAGRAWLWLLRVAVPAVILVVFLRGVGVV